MTRSMPVAAAAAVAASKTGRTVHYQQNRNEDFRINGGAFDISSTPHRTLKAGDLGLQPDAQKDWP